jgi:hypothetical protein
MYMGKLIRLASDDESFRVCTPRVCCVCVLFSGFSRSGGTVGRSWRSNNAYFTRPYLLSLCQTPWKSLCNSLPGSLWIAKFYNRSRVLYECDRPIVQVSQPSKPVPHSVPSKLLSVIQYKSYWSTQDVTILIAPASSFLLLFIWQLSLPSFIIFSDFRFFVLKFLDWKHDR